MSKKLLYFSGIIFFLFLTPIRGSSQTQDDTKSDKVERAHRKHVVKKAWTDTKNTAAKDYHATAHATGKAWSATKQGVSTGAQATAHTTKKAWTGTKRVVGKGYHATATATGKAWRGTKKAVTKGYNSVAHPPAKTNDKDKENHPDQIKQEGEPK